MIKQKTSPTKQATVSKVQVVDGPPLDFSFKNIRNLSEIPKLGSAVRAPEVQQEIPKNELFVPKNSQKQIGDGSSQARLNIVRTIQLDESRNDIVKQLINKKAEKVSSKKVHKIQTKTTSLFLRYNKLRQTTSFIQIAQQLLPGNRWEQLIWVDLSHNRLTQVDKQWCCLPQLKNLYLHVNFIKDFKEFQKLKDAKLLRTFTIHGNPIQNYPEFRCLLTSILPQLQKLDSALLTKREKERGQVIRKQNAKYPVITNAQKPPEESDDEEEA